MLIVLEGVDGAGKTTLTERIMSTLPDTTLRLHSGPLKGDPLREYVWRLRDYAPTSEMNIICDRWHVGELVYGPLYRDACKLTPAMRKYVEMYLDKLGAYKLVVTTDLPTIKQRLKDRGEDLLQDSHIGLVWDFYNEYAHRHGWQFVGSDEIMSNVTKRARILRMRSRVLWGYTSYVGPTHPRTLVFGAGSSMPLPGRPKYGTAFVPYPDTPYPRIISRFIEDEVGFADPLVDDPLQLWVALGRPNVIAADPTTERHIRSVPHSTLENR